MTTGVTANSSPASSPAHGPSARRTVRTSRATAATPISAWGTSTDQLDSPNNRIDRLISHSEAGGLSTVIEFAASEEPKNIAVQLWAPAWAAPA